MTTTQRGSAGTLLGGRYRLLGPLPGAGRSWRARDEIDDRPLLARAIELPDRLPEAERQRARQQALRDAAVVARVEHAGVAPVVDAVVEDGAPWVISVLPPGRSLGEIVTEEGPVSPVAAALIGLQVLEALTAAGAPHGELTPYDVLISDDGRVRVIGFATTPLGAVGTGGFGAPEGGPGPAADLWALGVTLHVAVEGRMPGGPRSRAGALEPALDLLLGRDPGRRSDVGAIRRLLAEAAGEPEAPAPPVGDLHDPEVVAALAAFDAALSAGPGKAAVPAAGPRSGASAQVAPVTDATPEPTRPEAAAEPAPDRPVAAPAPTPDRPVVAAEPTPDRPVVAAEAAPERPVTAAKAAPEPPAAAAKAAPEPPAAATKPAPERLAGASAPDRRAAAPRPIPWNAPAAGKPRAATPAPAPAAARLPAQTTPRPHPASETPIAKTPVPQVTTSETPVEETPARQTPVPQVPAPGMLVAETLVPQVTAPGTPVADTPVADTPIADTPVADTPVEETPVEESPVPRVPAAGTPVAETPARQTPVAQVAAPKPAVAGALAQPPAEPARRRRLGAVGIGIAVALVAVLALLLPFLFLRGDDQTPAAQPTAPVAVATATAEPTDASPSPDTPIPPPAGFQLYRDPAGWSIALPVGWTVTHRGNAVTFTNADRALRVTERTDPPKDTYVAAQKLEPVIQAATPGYDFVRLANVTYRAWPTTDYEFRAGSTVKTHSLIRSTVPSPSQVFDFFWTCPDQTWKADRALFDTAMRTFDPGA